jgi:hypothetical protein
LKRDYTKQQSILQFARALIDARNKETDGALNVIVAELRTSQKTIKGSFLVELADKIGKLQ